MADRTLEENIKKAITDFNNIETAIEDSGIPIPSGTKTSQYASKIRQLRKEEQTKALEVTENGSYDIVPDAGKVLSSATVNVDVPLKYDEGYSEGYNEGYDKGYDKGYPEGYEASQKSITLQEKTVMENGEVTADEGYTGLSKVNVAIPIKEEQEKTLAVTENGSYKVLPDENKVFSGVNIDVDVKPLPDWDDDSPIIASGKAYTGDNTHWEVTEKGTMRWVIDYPSNESKNNCGWYANSGAASIVLSVRPEIVPYLPKIKQVYVPDGITRTEFCFMVNCERVRIPDSLTSRIGIVGLASLREFDISHNVYSTLPDYYCSRMYALEKVILNDSLTTISRDCFSYCYSLKDINLENITTFGQACFNENMNLTQITFSAGLVSIEAQAFHRTGLTSITFQKPTGQPPTIASNAFGQCFLLTEVSVYEGWNITINLSGLNKLTQESLHKMIENLADLTGQTYQTFQVGSTNIAKIDEEHIAMLNTKNWNYI